MTGEFDKIKRTELIVGLVSRGVIHLRTSEKVKRERGQSKIKRTEGGQVLDDRSFRKVGRLQNTGRKRKENEDKRM